MYVDFVLQLCASQQANNFKCVNKAQMKRSSRSGGVLCHQWASLKCLFDCCNIIVERDEICYAKMPTIYLGKKSYVYESINTCRSELLKRLSFAMHGVDDYSNISQSYTPQIRILSHGVCVSATAANPKRITKKPFFASPHLFLRVALFNKRNVLLHNSIEREKQLQHSNKRDSIVFCNNSS